MQGHLWNLFLLVQFVILFHMVTCILQTILVTPVKKDFAFCLVPPIKKTNSDKTLQIILPSIDIFDQLSINYLQGKPKLVAPMQYRNAALWQITAIIQE